MTNDDGPPSPFNPNARSRGVLTKADREFLISQEEYQPQPSRDKRYRIRNRIEDAYLDFALIDMFLKDTDRESIFSDLLDGYGVMPMRSVLKFTYAGLDDIDEDIETLLQKAIEGYEVSRNPNVIPNVTVDIQVQSEEITIADAVHSFIAGDGGEQEFRFLLRHPEGLHELADQMEEADDHISIGSSAEGEASMGPEEIRKMAKEFTRSMDEE